MSSSNFSQSLGERVGRSSSAGGGASSPEKAASLQDAIIDLYLNVKIRSNDDINKMSEDQLEAERNKLCDISPFIIIEYIKSSIEILMNLKLEEHRNEILQEKERMDEETNDSKLSEVSREGPPRDYEAMLIKLEGEVRTHIRIEQQLKLHIENTQQKVEDLERANKNSEAQTSEVIEGMKKDNQRLLDLLSLRDQEVSEIKAQLERRMEEAHIDEERLTRTAQLEKQVIYLEKKYDRDISKLTKELKAQYKKNSDLKTILEQRGVYGQTPEPAMSGSISHRDVQNVRQTQSSLSKSPHESGRSTSRISTANKSSRDQKQNDLAKCKMQLVERNREIMKLKGQFSRSKEGKKSSSHRHYQDQRQMEPLGTSQLNGDRNSESYLLSENHNGYEQGSEIAKLKQKINRLQNQMTVSKKSSVERNPPVYEGNYVDCPGHKRSKSQLCGNQSQLMKTPDLDSHGTFQEFCGASGNHVEKGMYRVAGQEKENFSSDFMGCSDEFDGSAQRLPVRKSEIIEHQQHTPSTHYNQTSGSNTARERSASKPRISRPSSTLKEHHQQQYGNSHQHSKSGGNSQRGSTYLSSSMSQSSYKKKPNYGASGTAVSGIANNPSSGRTSTQYNYSRAKKSAL